MSIRPLYLAHELDAAWIIPLWIAIHGGDPSPEAVAAQAIAALGTARDRRHLPSKHLKAQFAELGVVVNERAKEETADGKPKLRLAGDSDDNRYRAHQYCFKFQGSTICTELPALPHLRTAA